MPGLACMLVAEIIALFESASFSCRRILHIARLRMIGTGAVLLTIGLAQILTGSAQAQAKTETPKACIAIQQMSPVGVNEPSWREGGRLRKYN